MSSEKQKAIEEGLGDAYGDFEDWDFDFDDWDYGWSLDYMDDVIRLSLADFRRPVIAPASAASRAGMP